MGKAWADASPAAATTLGEADRILHAHFGTRLTSLMWNGPVERLNQTDVSQPAIFAVSVACFRALNERGPEVIVDALAGLSLGEYTALHLAGAFSFEEGLRLVAQRGKLMQEAAVQTPGTMVAIVGGDDAQAEEVCRRAAEGSVLVPANYNAPGQVVLSGEVEACARAAAVAQEMGLKATVLTVAGAFHSPLMRRAADRMAETLALTRFQPLQREVWSNVTARPHLAGDPELLKRRLVEQIVEPVRWAQSCAAMPASDTIELAPGSVLRGLMRRIDRNRKVTSHDQP